ncbi:MAG: hypothetical protein JO057_05925, partial [Chloroflexi bacterium]|nr:hypothetical protein [Chloroflexota bacterium]
DSVQILVTVTDKSRNEAHARQVVDRAEVYEVGRDTSLTNSSPASSVSGASSDANSGSIASVTLAVTPDLAQQLAEARRTGDLDVLLLPPAGASQQ